MQIQTLRPELRKNLRDLLQGYVEHCEFSSHLTGRIDFPIYYQGFKYGAPVFTHLGPGGKDQDRPVIGLIGWNGPQTSLPSQVLLQFIEILTQHPRLADSSVLRILPVANPVALELEADAPERGEWDLLDRLADQFKDQSADGWIEVESADVPEFSLSGEISPDLIDELSTLAEIFRDRPGLILPTDLDLTPSRADERWQLKLVVPSFWSDSASIHGVARFVVRLVHAHSELLARKRRHPQRQSSP
ncbi:MAG: hypothetical protein JWO82_873 [Akkermansiaceae bacterium]|nr:hypothetical protein [Akkermansiaceae bacterium]